MVSPIFAAQIPLSELITPSVCILQLLLKGQGLVVENKTEQGNWACETIGIVEATKTIKAFSGCT